MTLDWWTLGLQTVNVVVLVWLLARFLFRPVSKIISARQAAAMTALDEAQAARAQAQAARDEATAKTAEVAAQRGALVATARDEAEREKQRLLDDARSAVEKARSDGAAQLKRMRAAHRIEMSKEASDLAADIAARLMARLPDSARIAGFIDGLAEAVGELPEATRAGIGAEGPVQIRAARTLTDDERTTLATHLAEGLGHALTLEIEADPSLLAGLELVTSHAIVRNHFRADLDRITLELAGDD